VSETRALTRKTRKAAEQFAESNRLEKIALQYVPLGTLKPNDWNPNRQSDHDFDLLLASMRTDGFTVPIIALKASFVIVDGEHRWRAARRLNEEARNAGLPEPYLEVPVVFVDMPEAQAKVATLRHNRARGSEDIELAAQLLRDLESEGALDWAQNELLMDDVEVQRMLSDVAVPEALASEEFSQAWIPQGTKVTGEASHDGYIGGANATEGATQMASDRLRQSEKAIAAAKTDEERQAVVRDRDIHRVAFTFAGEEAVIVKRALGDQPADKLLELCRKELGLEG
jgi:ParB-like chromosome segregation protein Spo0J